MKVHFYNIDWDSDGVKDLPKELTLEIDDNIDIPLKGADFLSDEIGFCVNSFNFKL